MPHYRTTLADEAATQALGKSLAACLSPGLNMHLHGDLGAGKTALTRALLHAAGHQGHVKSPTYTLVEIYQIQVAGNPVKCLHFDLYRMNHPEEFLDAGLDEEFNSHNICIIEWPEKAQGILPAADLNIFLHIEDHGRKVELQAMSDKGSECLKQLRFAPNL